jgi:hypothetical protein
MTSAGTAAAVRMIAERRMRDSFPTVHGGSRMRNTSYEERQGGTVRRQAAVSSMRYGPEAEIHRRGARADAEPSATVTSETWAARPESERPDS